MSIFISYRRQDGSGYAGRVFDRLKACFGSDRVFMDVTDIEPGLDFVEAIEKALSSCEALVVVVGRNWARLLAARADGAEPDFVGIEIATALERNVRVVPVLVGDAEMPRAGDLPDALKLLARRQAISLSDDRWDFDVDRLIKALGRVVEARADQASKAAPARQQPEAAKEDPAPAERTRGAPGPAGPAPEPAGPAPGPAGPAPDPAGRAPEPARGAPGPARRAPEPRARFVADVSRVGKMDHRTWEWSGDFPLPVEEAVETGRRALVSAEMSNVIAGRDRVTADVGPSLKSMGEDIWVEFVSRGEGASGVTVGSRSKVATTLFDWGKNRQNIEKVLAALAGVLDGS